MVERCMLQVRTSLPITLFFNTLPPDNTPTIPNPPKVHSAMMTLTGSRKIMLSFIDLIWRFHKQGDIRGGAKNAYVRIRS